MKSNFDILIARNSADMDRINNTRSNAGMLPTISLNGNSTYSYNNVYQKTSSESINKYPTQSTTNIGADAELSWTLYDGGKMFITKNKLAEIQALGELQFKSNVLDVFYKVTAAYYDIVKQEQELKSINEVINYNKQRVLIAETGFKAGQINKTELLQAQIDLNVATENAINQKNAISEAQKTLNSLLGCDAATLYDVSDSIPESTVPERNEVLLKLESCNTDILAYKKQQEVAKLALKETQKGYYPTLKFQGGYYLSHITNSEGATLRNNTNGIQLGGTLSVPIYNFGETKRKVSLAKADLLSTGYNLENIRLQVKTDMLNAYTDFENQQQLLQIEKDNCKLTKENLEISLKRLQLGQTTSLEVHQAQESYMESLTRLINFEYNLKVSETKIKQLISNL
ncbi:MAG: TolC family protein [Bacteroidaceae bacterium]|nr:TolC family protein [Bacteroidaceae bacterium]